MFSFAFSDHLETTIQIFNDETNHVKNLGTRQNDFHGEFSRYIGTGYVAIKKQIINT